MFFRIIARTIKLKTDCDRGRVLRHKYHVDQSTTSHSHTPDSILLRYCLPHQLKTEAFYLRDALHLRFQDVAAFLERNYNILIRKDLLRRRLNYSKFARDPKDEDCLRLCESLMQIEK